MADVDRYIRHPAAGTTGATDWFDADRPLGAGRVQLVIANNLKHLLTENAMRVLVTHPGARDVWRQAFLGGGFTGVPSAADVFWWYGPLPTGLSVAQDGGVNVCLGTHYVWKIPGTDRLPRVVLRATWWVEANAPTLGASLFVCPGRGTPQWGPQYVGDTTTGTVGDALELGVNLVESDVERVNVAPRAEAGGTPGDESGELFRFTAFLGGYCSSGSSAAGDKGHVVGISLCLEEPT